MNKRRISIEKQQEQTEKEKFLKFINELNLNYSNNVYKDENSYENSLIIYYGEWQVDFEFNQDETLVRK